jgi:hypothetical protein
MSQVLSSAAKPQPPARRIRRLAYPHPEGSLNPCRRNAMEDHRGREKSRPSRNSPYRADFESILLLNGGTKNKFQV